jgi:hypothetical protein
MTSYGDSEVTDSDRARAKQRSRSKYQPHQNLGEQARRLKQIRDGRLKGPVVSDAARFMAHGLLLPEQKIVRVGKVTLD